MRKFPLLLLVAPLALAACGGSSKVQADPLAYVKQSATKTAALPSEHMVLSGNIAVGANKLTMSGSGDFATATKSGQMSMAVHGTGQTFQIKEVIDGTTVYVTAPMPLPHGKTWMKLDLQKAGSSIGLNYSSFLSEDPAQALKQLLAAGSVKTVGAETIDGVATTHYQVTNLDISKMAQGEKLNALLHPKYGPIDVWVGNKDGYVYRESLSFSYTIAGQAASMSMRIDLSNFGEKVNVTVPPASDVFDATSIATTTSTTMTVGGPNG